MVDYEPLAPISTTSHGSTARMSVPHMHGVWAAALYVVLFACYLLPTWYITGLCAHESLGEKTDNIRTTGIHTRRKTIIEGLPRTPEGTDRARTSTNVSRRATP